MKQILILLLAISFLSSKAQSANEGYRKTMADIKFKSKIDKNDKVALQLITAFYNEVLQSDKGELENTTMEGVANFMKADDSKNKHLLSILLMYQQHIAQTAAKGLQPNAEFQVEAMNTLEKEFQDLYGVIPTIIYIYKSEALSSAGKFVEAKAHVKKGLAAYPKSIPLKVYFYKDTKDNVIKNELITNHANHWLVKQNNIK